MKATKEERRERARKRREEWQAELARLHSRQTQSQDSAARDRAHARNRQLLEAAQDQMRGGAFRAWYEATTGEPVSEFLADTLLTPEQFLARFDGRMRQLEWTQMRIERVVQDNPWTNPETKGLWAEQISLTTSPTERRRIIMRLATPRWANREAVTAVYLERERMIVETGILHQVDHIVPLVHPLVCGLHCEYNLRVTTAFENQSKSNFFEIS